MFGASAVCCELFMCPAREPANSTACKAVAARCDTVAGLQLAPCKRRERRAGFVNPGGRRTSDAGLQFSSVAGMVAKAARRIGNAEARERYPLSAPSSGSSSNSKTPVLQTGNAGATPAGSTKFYVRGTDVINQHLRLPSGTCEWESRVPHQFPDGGVDWRAQRLFHKQVHAGCNCRPPQPVSHAP